MAASPLLPYAVRKSSLPIEFIVFVDYRSSFGAIQYHSLQPRVDIFRLVPRVHGHARRRVTKSCCSCDPSLSADNTVRYIRNDTYAQAHTYWLKKLSFLYPSTAPLYKHPTTTLYSMLDLTNLTVET